jgi:TonB family protein
VIALALWLVASAAIQTTGTDESAWQWDGTTPICRLQQQTPSGHKIQISRTPGNEETEFKIYLQPRSKIREGKFRQGTRRLDTSSETLDVSTYQDSAGQLQVYPVSHDPMFMRRFSRAVMVEVSHRSIGTFRESLRASAAAGDALQNCEDQKLRNWGIDLIALRRLKSQPVPLRPISDQFHSLDYPRAALAAGIEADAVTRLDVDSGGRVARCQSLNAGLHREFEEAACDILQNVRFGPATDVAGNLVSAPYVYDVRFRIAR